jgi:hypothetical protein
MSKLVVASGVALVLVLGAGMAQAKRGGHAGGGACTEQKFQHCMDKCQAHGGPSKSSAVIKNCSKRCSKRC